MHRRHRLRTFRHITRINSSCVPINFVTIIAYHSTSKYVEHNLMRWPLAIRIRICHPHSYFHFIFLVDRILGRVSIENTTTNEKKCTRTCMILNWAQVTFPPNKTLRPQVCVFTPQIIAPLSVCVAMTPPRGRTAVFVAARSAIRLVHCCPA